MLLERGEVRDRSHRGNNGRTVPIEVKYQEKFSTTNLDRYLMKYDVKDSVIISMRAYSKREKEYVPFYAIEWMARRHQ